MRVLVATDAWPPQVNGVVRTLTSLEAAGRNTGLDIEFLSPDGFSSFDLPSYPGLRLAIPEAREIARRIDAARPDAIHVATEGPIGHSVRAYCVRNNLPFTTSFTTKFPEYIAARFFVPASWSYWFLRRFHAAGRVTMASTNSLVRELRGRGFRRLGLWTRGVDTALFDPGNAVALDLPRPIFMNVGRVAVEKNLEAFLSLDLPRIEGRHRQRAAIARVADEIPAGPFPRREAWSRPRCPSGRRGRVRVPEPNGYLRRRATRGARLRRSCRGVSRDWPARRDRRTRDRSSRRGSPRSVPACADDPAPGLP